MKISDYIVYEIGYKTYQINERGMDSFYVLAGTERGLVIDCGAGSINAREIVEKLCPVPYDVLIGHAHGDHCGAINQWEQVYMHPGDLSVLGDNYRVNEQLWENPNIWHTGSNHKVRWPDGSIYEWPTMDAAGRDLFDYTNFRYMGVNPEKMPKILPLSDGDIFELGDRQVRVVHMSGHTPGSCCFIDSGSRIAFTSDSLYMLVYANACSVEELLKNLKHFNSYRSEFDRIYYGHTSCATCLSNFSLPVEAIDDAIQIAESLIAGTQEYEIFTKQNGQETGRAELGHIVGFYFDPKWITNEE